MPDTRARLIIEARDQASAQFEAIFARINAKYGDTKGNVQKLTMAQSELERVLRKLAEAGSGLVGLSGTQVKAYTDLANAAGKNAAMYKELEHKPSLANTGFKVFGMNIVDIAAKFYLLQTSIRAVVGGIVGLFKLAELGAKVEQAGISFDRLSASLGLQPDLMNKLRDASRGF